ncbi:MAG: prephenate dehydrogenase [Actinomycetaceae bacterium]|nr:prephenate dehydrogenase [Actinomycetaceae bacterium]
MKDDGLQSVLIIGTGLLGASLGLALSAAHIRCYLQDSSPTALALARDMGAGTELFEGAQPQLVVVCVPPDVAGTCVGAALKAYPHAVVTDVASVKQTVLQEVQESGADTSRYVGSHPMAGRERSGPDAADRDLFTGRPWIVVPHEKTDGRAKKMVQEVIDLVGAVARELDASEHDRAVALVSHVPQLAASLLAARLEGADPAALSLAGQGLRDTTRIARSNPALWAAIISANSAAVAGVLEQLRADLDYLIEGLQAEKPAGLDVPGRARTVATVVSSGNAGVDRIPGKHGGAPKRYTELSVLVPDEPGELGRLFSEMGEENINLEDLSLEHSAGAALGIARLQVLPANATPLARALTKRGWQVV